MDNQPGQGPGTAPEGNEKPKPRPIYLSWRLWLAILVGLLLITAGTSVAFGPGIILKALFDPASWVGLSVIGAGVYGVWLKIEEKSKESRKLAEAADLKANIAAIAAKSVSNQTNTNSADIVALGQAYRELVDGYQQSRLEIIADQDADRVEIAELKLQLRELSKENAGFQREITELKQQLRELGRENVADKQEITLLRARVATLEMEVAKLTIENSHLLEENRDLKSGPGLRNRWGTDQLITTETLTGLPSDIQKEFDALNNPAIKDKNKDKNGENNA